MNSWEIIWHQSLVLPTLIYSLLLVVSLGYWFLVIVGALGFEGTEVEFEAELEANIEADLEVGAEGVAPCGMWLSGLHFLGLGRVPLMVVVSVMSLSGWCFGVVASMYLFPLLSGLLPFWLFALILFPLQFIGAGFVSNRVSIPVSKLTVFHPERGHQHLVGSTCKVTSGKVTPKLGTAQVEKPGNPPLLLNVRTKTDEIKLEKHQEAVIVAFNQEKNTYFIQPLSLEQ